MTAAAVNSASAQTVFRSPQAGAPRRWEAGLAVSPFTTVNLYNGNALTVLPVFGVDPVGPPLVFALYHNSTAVAWSGTAPWGFDFGGGWRPAYGSGIVDNGSSGATLIEDDGNEWDYTRSGGVYYPPPGKYDRLVKNGDGTWTLTRPNLTVRHFDTSGRLTDEVDSSGNALTIERYTSGTHAGKWRYINSAAHGLTGGGGTLTHRLEFTYDDTTGRLTTVTFDGGGDFTRSFDFAYESGSTHRLNSVEDARNHATTFAYKSSTNHKLATITDRAGNEWTYDYTAGRLDYVEDPDPFFYVLEIAYPSTLVNGLYRTVVTDRRGYDWDYRFDPDTGDCKELHTPAASPNTRTWTYDSAHNRLTATNELGKTWTATYVSGTPCVATVTSPLTTGEGAPTGGQRWTYTWEQPDGTNLPNFWRLTEVEDPLERWVQFVYDEDGDYEEPDPTHVVSIIEMDADGTGDDEPAVTHLEYYQGGDPSANGQLCLVTDANGVKHKYEYDAWGFFQKLTEGIITTGYAEVYPTVIGPNENNPDGTTSSATGDAGASGESSYDENGNLIDDVCAPITQSNPPPIRLGVMPSPWRAFQTNCTSGNTFDVLDRPTAVYRTIDCGETRDYHFAYDEVGRPTSLSIETDEPGGSSTLTRTFEYADYDENGHLLTRTGPDGQDTTCEYDELGRPTSVSRNSQGVSQYHWDAASRLTQVDFANGAKTCYTYDGANRLTRIQHKNASNALLYQTDYVWSADNTVETRTETDNVNSTAADVEFTYDARGRLIGEQRTGDLEYNIAYSYDQLGNRLTKIDSTDPDAIRLTEYFYDTDPDNRDPAFQTNNNRLLWYTEKLVTDGPTETLLRTVWYTYWKTGDVSNITVKDRYVNSTLTPGSSGDYDWYHDLAFYYTTSGQVWEVVKDKWKKDGSGNVTDYTREWAREFRYDSPRARYLTRPIEANDDNENEVEWEPLAMSGWEWTEYDSCGAGSQPAEPYGDFSVALDGSNDPVVTNVTHYIGGFGGGPIAQQTVSGGATTYKHDDLIGSVQLSTDGSGAAGSSPATLVYTAFGEHVTAGSGSAARIGWPVTTGSIGATRYHYAGAHGYESGLLSLSGPNSTLAPITLQHVGARWYQPGIGRFVQRDPLGLRGGWNVYLYVHGNPLLSIDPLGLLPDTPWCWKDFWSNVAGGAAAGAVGGTASAIGPGFGAALGAGGGAAKYTSEWSFKCIWETLDYLSEASRIERANDQRQNSRPDIFPHTPVWGEWPDIPNRGTGHYW